MTRLAKTGALAALVFAVCLALAACGGNTTTTSDGGSGGDAAPKGPIKLGYVVPDWTNLLKATGRRDLNAKQMISAAQKEMGALVDDANANGGVDGRRIVATPYIIDQLIAPDAMNAECAKITEDGQQQVLIDVSIFTTEQSWSCFADHQTAYVGIVTTTDSDFLRSVSPYVTSIYPPIDHQMQAMANELPKVDFFRGKLGVVLEDTPVLHHDYEATLAPALRSAGVTPTVKFVKFHDTAAINNAVLAFKGAGIDHIIMFLDVTEYLGFTNQAQQQGYHPAYAFPDFQALDQVAGQFGNPVQNATSVAVSGVDSWSGVANDASRISTDQFSPIRPGQVPAAQIACRRLLGDKLGLDYMNPGQARSSAFEAAYCDNFHLWLESARKVGKGWTPQQFGDGLRALGGTFGVSQMHAVDYSNGTIGGGASQFAVGVYTAKCKCFVRRTDWSPLS